MKKVIIYKLQDDGEQTEIVSCSLENEVDGVICKGDEIFIANLTDDGIKDYSGPEVAKPLFPKDGLLFLEQLGRHFRYPYMSASEIIEG